MKKEEQLYINEVCNEHFNKAVAEYNAELPTGKKLRSCTANVYETENYYLLKSYYTFIACICKANDTLYDVLRTEYGYTPTSSKHISKFDHDYCAGTWGCDGHMTSR